ncbi:MAG: hypothetical protein NC132_06495, partial [Corallococcus sp.]|nr:hypothetical protein [Corallococcus sp.]
DCCRNTGEFSPNFGFLIFFDYLVIQAQKRTQTPFNALKIAKQKLCNKKASILGSKYLLKYLIIAIFDSIDSNACYAINAIYVILRCPYHYCALRRYASLLASCRTRRLSQTAEVQQICYSAVR